MTATPSVRIFASERAAHAWFKENDPEGVAFEYLVKTGEPVD